MNFRDTMKSVELVLSVGQVPLLVGDTGIGKTSLARKLAERHGWSMVTIDGNLLKEGEIGGLPTVVSPEKNSSDTMRVTVYAVHHLLRRVAEETAAGREVLLFIDEINRCEHAVQQELMNLILNREINGFVLPDKVHIVAAMNPADRYEYQTVEMDVAQQNRFVWLTMEADYLQWLDWAAEEGLDETVIEFIATFPEYLNKSNTDDLQATPRSYERVSALYRAYMADADAFGSDVFYNVVRGNVGTAIAREFMAFIESDRQPLLGFDDVFGQDVDMAQVAAWIQKETPTRLYLAAKHVLRYMEERHEVWAGDKSAVLQRLVEWLGLYPEDLRLGLMKDMKNTLPYVYDKAKGYDGFVDMYFAMQRD